MLRRSERKKRIREEEQYAEDMDDKVKDREKELLNILSPFESYIMSFQSLLVWENPTNSVIFLTVVHILFWLGSTIRLFYFVGVTGVVVVFYDLWTCHIWPEIRVPPPPGEDEEDWTPVYPNYMSVPEICSILAQWWVNAEQFVHRASNMRQVSHAKFFIYSAICCSIIAVIGHYVPGIYLSYILVMSCILWPCAWYHNLLQRLYEIFEPHLMQLENKMKIKRKSRKGTPKKRTVEGEGSVEIESDSDGEDKEFMPSLDPKKNAALAKIITDSEDETESTRGGLDLDLTPRAPSCTDSIEYSDNESNMSSFLGSVKEMPSIAHIEDSLTDLHFGLPENASLPSIRDTIGTPSMGMPSYDDPNNDNAQDTPTKDTRKNDTQKTSESASVSRESSAVSESRTAVRDRKPKPTADEKIHFVSSHFKDSDDNIDDDDDLTRGLSFPDVDDDSLLDDAPSIPITIDNTDNNPDNNSLQAQLLSNVASQLVTQTVSNFMSNTVAGLSRLSESVSHAAASRKNPDQDCAKDSGTEKDQLVDSVDTDIVEAEFEFLSQEDLEDENVDTGNRGK